MEVIVHQQALLASVYSRLKPDNSLAKALSNTLRISKREAYNKISGKSLLTLSQINHLCESYEVNFLINGREFPLCAQVNFLPFHREHTTIDTYLQFLKKSLVSLKQANEKQIYCAVEDIPIFHLFRYPEIAAFKLYFWKRSNEINSSSPIEDFDASFIGGKLIDVAYELSELYLQIPSTEIWSNKSFTITANQIKYAAECDLIKDKNLGKVICNQLYNCLKDIEGYAINECKKEDKNIPYNWHNCDTLNSTAYHLKENNTETVFLRFNNFSNLHTTDHQLCNEVRLWMKSLMHDCTDFNGRASKHRSMYLRNAYNLCQDLSRIFI